MDCGIIVPEWNFLRSLRDLRYEKALCAGDNRSDIVHYLRILTGKLIEEILMTFPARSRKCSQNLKGKKGGAANLRFLLTSRNSLKS